MTRQNLPMTPRQYQLIRERLGFSNYMFHRIIAVSLRQAQRYESGESPIDATVSRLMIMLDRHGVPREWIP